jgi:hypothetical protein
VAVWLARAELSVFVKGEPLTVGELQVEASAGS